MSKRKRAEFGTAQEPEPKISKKDLPKKDRRLLTIIGLAGFVTVAIGIVLIAFSAVNYFYEAVPQTEVKDYVFDVPKGSGLSSIANRLERDGLIDNAFIFKFVTKMRGNEANFKAGEFLISQPASMSQIYDILAEGKAILYPFTAPEGLTSAQILRSMNQVETLVMDDVETPAEGTLLPETYLMPRDMKRSELIEKMRSAQADLIDRLWQDRQTDLPIKTKEEAIILASVVEKETGVNSERDIVAGVFINRLRKGMRLQSDPTIIYGISQGEPLGRGIRRSEIDRKTDWNTYQMDGLPKTPICNPGADAIAAVLQPAETNMLYFVADGTGGHVFAKTLVGHLNNVRKWRKIERDRKRAAQ